MANHEGLTWLLAIGGATCLMLAAVFLVTLLPN